MNRENKLRQLLARGEVALGAIVHIPATAIVEIMGRAGFDFTIVDLEHGLYDTERGGELIRTAQGANLTALVRVLKNDPALIMKALDLGAEGVIVPHISTRDDAAQAIQALRYGPGGSRGACPLVRAVDYGLADWRQHETESSKQAMLVLLIEDLQGARNIDEILSLEGIDAVCLGAFDMSVSAGHTGNFKHPEVCEALDKILAVCREHKMPVMHSMTFVREPEAWVAQGVRLIYQSADSFVLAQAYRSFLASMSHVRKGAKDASANSSYRGENR